MTSVMSCILGTVGERRHFGGAALKQAVNNPKPWTSFPNGGRPISAPVVLGFNLRRRPYHRGSDDQADTMLDVALVLLRVLGTQGRQIQQDIRRAGRECAAAIIGRDVDGGLYSVGGSSLLSAAPNICTAGMGAFKSTGRWESGGLTAPAKHIRLITMSYSEVDQDRLPILVRR